MTRASAFTKTDVVRAMKAVESGGARVKAVDFLPGGGFRVLTGEYEDAALIQDNEDWTESAGEAEVSGAHRP